MAAPRAQTTAAGTAAEATWDLGWELLKKMAGGNEKDEFSLFYISHTTWGKDARTLQLLYLCKLQYEEGASVCRQGSGVGSSHTYCWWYGMGHQTMLDVHFACARPVLCV